jgi:HEAT repeat protein
MPPIEEETTAARLAALEALPAGAERDEAILAALEDEVPAVRERAIRLATRYIEPQVLGELVADEVNATRRNGAITALERQGPYAVPHLQRMLARPEPDVVMFALQMLARIADPSAVAAVVPLMRHADPNIAQSAVEALGRLRSTEAVPALLALLDGDLWLQLAAIDALGEIGDSRAVAPLLALVPDSIVAEPAVRALHRIAAPDSLGLLLARLQSVRERSLRDALLLAIGVVIDLHPDPAPVAIQFTSVLKLDPSDDVLGYLEEILCWDGTPPEGSEPRDSESLLRAAAVLAVAAGIHSLYPIVLRRIATDDDSAWITQLFHRYPDALAPALTEMLGHSDSNVRRGALLAGSFTAEDVHRLAELLQDKDELIRAAACRALGSVGVAEAVPLLVQRLRNGEAGEQTAAAEALAACPADALQALEPCLKPDAPEPVTVGALEVLAHRGATLFEKRIIELTRHRSPALRQAALRAAAQLSSSQAEVQLFRALADKHRPIQVEALELLVRRDAPKTAATLIALLGTNDSLRYHVIRALGLIRATGAATKLESLYPECGPYEQVEIVLALVRIGAPSLAGFLRARLSDPEPEIRRVAARGIADLADRAQLPLLLSLAADADWCVRHEAARGLGLLGLAECQAPLLTLVRDVEPVVTNTAREALDRLRTRTAAQA